MRRLLEEYWKAWFANEITLATAYNRCGLEEEADISGSDWVQPRAVLA